MHSEEPTAMPISIQTPELPVMAAVQNPKPRIRVLHSIGHLLRGGIETWLYQMLQRFDSDRYEHHILVRTDKEEPFTQAFRQAGFRVLPCLNYGNPVKYKANFRRVVEQNGPYDILHVHGSNPNGLMALMFARQVGISATIVHSHNDVQPLLENRGTAYRTYVGLTLRWLRKLADRGFACSILAAESMFGPAWREDKRWQLLYNGVDFEPFAQPPDPNLRSQLGIPEDAFVVGHVGRFHEQKNHEFLVKIADALIKKCPDARFLLIGNGALRDKTVSELQRRGLDRNVVLVADTTSMPQFMLSAMDCFVLPSRYEGLPLVSVEAQAAGLPCVFSDRITRELAVDPKLVKFLSLEDSPELWADAILESKGRRVRDPQEHLKQFYASKHNPDRCADLLRGTYDSLVSNDRAATSSPGNPIKVSTRALSRAS